MGDYLLVRACTVIKLGDLYQIKQSLLNKKNKVREKLSINEPVQYLDEWSLSINRYC